jgi:hypothetical protein
MEIIVKLSPESLDALAERVVEIQDKKKKSEKKPIADEPQYTVNEVAEMCKRSPNVIRKHITKDKLLTASKVGKSWLIKNEDYQKYITNEQ